MERVGVFRSGGRLWRPPGAYTSVYAAPAPEAFSERVERWARRLLGL